MYPWPKFAGAEREQLSVANSLFSSRPSRLFSPLLNEERSPRLRKQWPASFDGCLSHRHHGVHVTQAIGQRFHHMRRKMRRLLNEKVKPAPVDLRQTGGFLRHGVGCARGIIDQRHLAKQRARTRSLEHEITKEDIDFTVQQDVHFFAVLAFPEQEIARRELQRVTFLTKKLRRIHRATSTARSL